LVIEEQGVKNNFLERLVKEFRVIKISFIMFE